MKAIVIGDVHRSFELLNDALKHYESDVVLQCGELGFWPRFNGLKVTDIDNGDCKIYFCDGNHDDHDALNELQDKEVAPNIFFMDRGQVITIGNKNIMFIGGAMSIDKQYRTEGHDWFRSETISDADFRSLPDPDDIKIDIVISHTAPDFIVDKMMNKTYYLPIYDRKMKFSTKFPDVSAKALELIFEMYKPKEWYFGHWHIRDTFEVDGCKFEALAALVHRYSPEFKDTILEIDLG